VIDNFTRMNAARTAAHRRQISARLSDLLLGCLIGAVVGYVAGVL